MKSESQNLKDISFLGISIAVHFLFFVFFHFVKIPLEGKKLPPPPVVLDLSQISLPSDKVVTKNQSQIDKKSQLKGNQIVNTEQSSTKVPLKKTRFLGEKSQAFKKESIAKKVGQFNKAGEGKKDGKSLKKASELKKSEKGKVGEVQEKRKKGVGLKDFTAFGNQSGSSVFSKPNLEALGVKNGDSGSTGLSANDDYIEGIALGDFTRLNTQEFKYYGYYLRIRQRISQHWGNNLERFKEKVVSGQVKIPKKLKYITKLEVIMNSKGKIVNIVLVGDSGSAGIDNTAINAFRQAGPFPNPPRGMVVKGKVKLEWGFHLN